MGPSQCIALQAQLYNHYRKIFELIISRDGVVPAGLGCRDTLRFEARLPLYGNELSDQVTPLDTGLKRFIDLEGDAFIGQESLRIQAQNGVDHKLYGLEMIDKGIARTGVKVYELLENNVSPLRFISLSNCLSL